MRQYKFVITVNGRRTEQIVTAQSVEDGKKLIQAQYGNANISFLSWTYC